MDMQAEDGERLVLFVWKRWSGMKDTTVRRVLTFVRDPCGFDDLHRDDFLRSFGR
jgi:hypothetical protein